MVAALSDYRLRTARRDALAALTVASVAIPAGMGYAEVAGLSPVQGLYALLLPTVAYALLGSSRRLVVGPDGAVSALVGAVVLADAGAGGAGGTGIAGTLALLVAACFLVARLARLGWIADYFSRPVLVGYIHGICGVLLVGQLPKLLGLDVSSTDPLHALVKVVEALPSANAPTLAVGLSALGILLVLRRLAPRVPGSLLIVLAAIVGSSVLGLSGHGVAVVGAVAGGLPELGLPSAPASGVASLAPAALGLFLVIFADGILTARTYAERHAETLDTASELLAFGVAEVAAGISQGFPVAASGSRTAVNDTAGARTQAAGLFTAAIVAGVLLFLTGPITQLPTAALAAIIIAAAIGLIDLEAWRELARADPVEVTIAAVTTAGVIVVGVLPAIGFAVGLSIVDVVRRSARPHDAVLGWVPALGRYGDVSLYASARIEPGVVVYRVDDRLFFANAGYVRRRVHEAVRGSPSPVHWVVLDAAAITHIDAAGVAALHGLATELAVDGITIAVARLTSPMRERFDETGLTATIGASRLHPTVRAAVRACASSPSGAGDAGNGSPDSSEVAPHAAIVRS